MKEKIKIQSVKRIVCPKCGELEVKIYPWSAINLSANQVIPVCIKCQNSSLKSGVA